MSRAGNGGGEIVKQDGKMVTTVASALIVLTKFDN